MAIIDITPKIQAASPVYPGDAALSIEVTATFPARVSAFRMSPHLGAHVDAPLHLNAPGDVSQIVLFRLVGECRILHCEGLRAIEPDDIPDNLATQRVLIKTGFLMPDQWTDDFAYLTKEAVEKLVRLGVDVVGIDTPSIDKATSETLPAHTVAIDNGMLILENLALSEAHKDVYTLVALPLKIEGLEASPVRAILIDEE